MNKSLLAIFLTAIIVVSATSVLNRSLEHSGEKYEYPVYNDLVVFDYWNLFNWSEASLDRSYATISWWQFGSNNYSDNVTVRLVNTTLWAEVFESIELRIFANKTTSWTETCNVMRNRTSNVTGKWEQYIAESFNYTASVYPTLITSFILTEGECTFQMESHMWYHLWPWFQLKRIPTTEEIQELKIEMELIN